jgi:hypothetical protein
VVRHDDIAGLDCAVGWGFGGLFFCAFFGHLYILNFNGLNCLDDCKYF